MGCRRPCRVAAPAQASTGPERYQEAAGLAEGLDLEAQLQPPDRRRTHQRTAKSRQRIRHVAGQRHTSGQKARSAGPSTDVTQEDLPARRPPYQDRWLSDVGVRRRHPRHHKTVLEQLKRSVRGVVRLDDRPALKETTGG